MKRLEIMTIAAIALVLSACGNSYPGQAKPSPEETVEAFTKAVASGDTNKALSFCDSTSMGEYLANYREILNRLAKKNSTALSIASGILANSPIEITKTEKQGQQRYVFYRIEAGNRTKERKATLRKEEGEWKVTAITDVN